MSMGIIISEISFYTRPLFFHYAARGYSGHRGGRCKLKAYRETPAQQHRQGGPPIFPWGELFGLARRIADGDFKDVIACLQNTGSDLRLNLESASLHRERSCQYTRHQLVARLHVMNVGPV